MKLTVAALYPILWIGVISASPTIYYGNKIQNVDSTKCSLHIMQRDAEGGDPKELLSYPCGPTSEGLVTGVTVARRPPGPVFWTLFWADTMNGDIRSTPIDGASNSTMAILVAGLNEPLGLTVDEDSLGEFRAFDNPLNLYFIDSAERWSKHGPTSINKVSIDMQKVHGNVTILTTNFSQTGTPRCLSLKNRTLVFGADNGIGTLNKALNPQAQPELIYGMPECHISEGLVTEQASSTIYFSKFYGGIYSLDSNVPGNSSLRLLEKSTYGTFGLSSSGGRLYYTQTTAMPPGVSLNGDIFEYDIGTSKTRIVCLKCTSGSNVAVVDMITYNY